MASPLESSTIFTLRRAKFAEFITSSDDDVLINPTLMFRLYTGDTEVYVNKLMLLYQCPQLREEVRAIASPQEGLDVSKYTTNGPLLLKAAGLLEGHTVPERTDKNDVTVHQLRDLFKKWMGDRSSIFVKRDYTPNEFNNNEPVPSYVKFKTRDIKYLRYISAFEDPEIIVEAHGMELILTKFDLFSRLPGLWDKIHSSPDPGSRINITQDVPDEGTFELVIAIAQGMEVPISPPFDDRVEHVLRKWADEENLKIIKSEDK